MHVFIDYIFILSRKQSTKRSYMHVFIDYIFILSDTYSATKCNYSTYS
jgi:hypothetical protein